MNPTDSDLQPRGDLFVEVEAEESLSGLHVSKLHGLLRDRYHWAIPLGLVLACAGALGGYFSQGKVYRSTSRLSISPIRQQILTDRVDDSIARYFESWVATQLELLQSPPVLEAAMASDEWQETAFGAYKSSPKKFSTGLVLRRRRGEGIIGISYEAPEPELARVGASVITHAYLAILEKRESQSESHLMRQLQKRQLQLEEQAERLQAKKRDLSAEHNDRTIGSELDRMTNIRDNLKLELDKVRFELASLGVDTTGGEQQLNQLTLKQLASQDPKLAALLQSKAQLESEIDYKTRLGMGDRHQEMKNAHAALDTLNAQIESQAQSLRGTGGDSWTPGVELGNSDNPVAVLHIREKQLAQQYEDAQSQTQHLGRIYSQMQAIGEDIDSVTQKLALTLDRIDKLQAEGGALGRAEIITPGVLPSKPFNTGKRKQLATLGAMAGLCTGFGLVLLIGMMDRRMRHYEDAQLGLGNTRMLGVLPELPEDLTDPDQAVLASHCVHQIRGLLQIDPGPEGAVLSITGPAAGSGKTSLTMALGMSFAACGSKTLLIDCDIVGGGLTQRMLDKPQAGSSLGILEACNGTTFDACVVKAAAENLWVLPIGSALPSQAGNLSPSAMKKLLNKAREAYDTIIIDTGPILGSLEAALASAQADKTVVIVSRGDQKPVVTKSLEHLRSIGAKIAGIVFNHADSVDIERSTYASVTLSQNRRQDDKMLNEVQWIDCEQSTRYGPLATAVASYGRHPQDANEEQG